MEILSVNAQTKLASIASSIGRNPLSWQGWSCLHVSLLGITNEQQQECLLWTKSILESYLQEAEGRIYFCETKDIHVICKNVPYEILTQTGSQICELVQAESGVSVSYTIHDLARDGFSYAAGVLEKSDVFSLPISTHAGFGGMEAPEFTPDQGEEKLLLDQTGAVKVLLVEDDPVTRWMVRNSLKHTCEFATAPCANKAFSMYSSYQPDVVFLDINLPDSNGFTVLEWIMNNDPGACVVMFSSNNNLDNISTAMEDGASGFIAKPFLKEQLLHYVENR